MRFSKYEKSQILSSELYHPVKLFDEKLCIYETCHKHVYKNETPSQAVCNKMALDPLPDELKDFKKLGDILISKRFFFSEKKGLENLSVLKLAETHLQHYRRSCKYMQYFITYSSFQGLILVKLKRGYK